MNAKQAAKDAAKQSKDGAVRFVVWVFDQGRDVYNADQAKRYAACIDVEAAYLNGVQIAHTEALAA